MALENITAGSTIADLDFNNPGAGDDVALGDDHLRAIKKALRYTYVNLSATVSAVAAELDFAHKGGTVSGNAVIKGDLSVSGVLNAPRLDSFSAQVVSINAILAGGGGGSVSYAVRAGYAISAGEALHSNSASYADSASRAQTAVHAGSASSVNGVKTYLIKVDKSGTASFISNWSASTTRNGSGAYTITHRFGVATYLAHGTTQSGVWNHNSQSTDLLQYVVRENDTQPVDTVDRTAWVSLMVYT